MVVTKRMASLPCLLILFLALLLSKTSNALTQQDAGQIDWHVPRIGVPIISSKSATQYLTPRFHRLVRPNQDPSEKSQTAIFVATESNALGAINPRNGHLVWRHIYDDSDPLLSFHTSADVLLSISGAGGANVRLHHGLSGFIHWETLQHHPRDGLLPEAGFPGVDASFLSTDSVLGDVVTLANARTVRRLDARSGRELWRWEHSEGPSSRIAIRVLATSEKVHVVSLRKIAGSYALSVDTLSHSGEHLASSDLPSSVPGGPADVTILPWAPLSGAPAAANPGAWVAWVNKDGSARAAPLDPPTKKLAQPQVIYSKNPASNFTTILDVGLGDKGMFVAKRSDGLGQVLKLDSNAKLVPVWEFEEEAYDAVYHGTYDRKGNAYVNRIFFSRAQHLLNFHVFWADAKNGGEGQVTGSSFQWDHDLHGNVLAAPFEASQMSQFQLITRAVFVTSSGSVQLLQDNRHQWIIEEGLSQTSAVALIDLPERKLSSLEGGAATLERESFIDRLVRHVVSLQDLPEYLFNFAQRFVTGSYGAFEQAKSLSSSPSSSSSSSSATTTIVSQPGKGAVRKVTNDVPPPTSVAPRVASSNSTSSLYRDPFGFRKLIVATTKKGKIYAMDSSRKEAYIWEKSLVGYGQGEGELEPVTSVRQLSLVRPLGSHGLGPLLVAVADIKLDENVSATRVFELDPLTGEFVDGQQQTGTLLFVGSPKDAFLLPIEDHETKQQVVAAIDRNMRLHLHPDSPSVVRAFQAIRPSFYFTLEEGVEGRQQINGYAVKVSRGGGSAFEAFKVWQLPFAEGETIVSTLTQSLEHLASLGRVLGDRSTLYKYLNPHAQVVTTMTPASSAAGVYVIDRVTGSILYEARLEGVDVEQGIQATFVENWLVYTFAQRTAEEGLTTRMVSVELYEPAGRDQTWEWKGNFSSFSGDSTNPITRTAVEPTALSHTFILPYGVRALATTTTKFGISVKNVLVATDRETLFSIPRRVLDPRRPVGKPTKAEAEEFLPVYDAFIPPDPKWIVSHVFPLGKVDKVVTSPALLESTSTVLAYGLDYFFTRVSPSGQFDILQESFNKPQLLLTIAALSVGIIITRPMVRGRSLDARW
ncbi:DUF1620-domain-containing protein [Violaceomyces palustris]|uniref:DUF1620-domain-containing protein n=1 Tax=Violaceomyces palustris TaxID=1673888 RepID=A0ACD0NPG2_9BASI|nr:DUF1620-domain-containing protein [Violaceomyces palustris]